MPLIRDSEYQGWLDRFYNHISKYTTRYILAYNALKAIQEKSTDPTARGIAALCLYEMEHCKDKGFEKQYPNYGNY